MTPFLSAEILPGAPSALWGSGMVLRYGARLPEGTLLGAAAASPAAQALFLGVCPAPSEEQAIWIMVISPLAPDIGCFKHLEVFDIIADDAQGCQCRAGATAPWCGAGFGGADGQVLVEKPPSSTLSSPRNPHRCSQRPPAHPWRPRSSSAFLFIAR